MSRRHKRNTGLIYSGLNLTQECIALSLVLGLSFGFVIRDFKLVRKGMWTEIIALTLCCFLGIILGVVCVIGDIFVETWPTPEMSSRGDVAGLITGIAIAIPSGMGVALSTLGNNTSR